MNPFPQLNDNEMTYRQKAILEVLTGTIGYGLLWYATNWMAALGLFIAMFANNIGQSKS